MTEPIEPTPDLKDWDAVRFLMRVNDYKFKRHHIKPIKIDMEAILHRIEELKKQRQELLKNK